MPEICEWHENSAKVTVDIKYLEKATEQFFIIKYNNKSHPN